MRGTIEKLTLLLCVGVLFAGASCTGVQLSDVSASGPARFLCRFNWKGRSSGAPDSLVLAMARSINTVHDTSHLYVKDTRDTLYVPAGDYHALIWGFSSPDDYTVVNAGSFLSNKNVTLLDIRARLNDAPSPGESEGDGGRDDLEEVLRPQDETNLPLLRPATAVWHSYLRQELYYRVEDVDLLIFEPSSFLQQITFRVRIKTDDENVTVSRVKACINGVGRSVGLLNASISPDDLGRMIFDMSKLGDGVFTGSINCLGLLPPVNAEDLFGRGILILAIELEGVDQIIDVHLNLLSELGEAALAEEIENSGQYRLLKDAGTVNLLARVVHIKKEDAETAGTYGAFETWIETDGDDGSHTIDIIPDEPDE